LKGGENMNKKIARNIVMGLIVLSALAAVVTSAIIWHQAETPSCIA